MSQSFEVVVLIGVDDEGDRQWKRDGLWQVGLMVVAMALIPCC